MRAASRSMFLIILLVAVVWLPAAAQVVIATLPSEGFPASAALNSVTNKTYVANNCGTDPNCQGAFGTVTVIDGATFGEQNVNVGIYPYGVAVNSVTNKIYVATCGTDPSCSSNGAITVIDGATLNTQSVTVGVNPDGVAVDSATNKIYVSNLGCNSPPCSVQGTVTVIDGATLATQTVNIGYYPYSITVDSTHNKIYVPNVCGSTNNCGTYGNVTVIDGVTLGTQAVPVQQTPLEIAVNETTNKIYVVNNCGSDSTCQGSGTVTVIDGSTLATQQVNIGFYPKSIAVNPTTNEIYVADQCSATFNNCSTSFPTVAIINGSTLATNFVTVCSVDTYPSDVEINKTTNKIFLPCAGRNDGLGNSTGLSVAILDGATNTIFPVAVGDYPFAAVVNAVTNTVYVPNVGDNTVSVIGAATKLQFVSLTPCRVVDTRSNGGAIQGGTSRSFNLPQLGGCNIPTTAAATSLNVTIVPPQHSPIHYLTIWPSSQNQPVVSTMNSLDGRIKANAAIIQAGVNGAVSVYVSNTTDVVLDVDGYFTPSTPSTLQFFPLTPCRVFDTRSDNGPLGGPFLTGGQERDFPVLSSDCNIPSSAQAYSMNFTVVPYQGQRSGYLTVWAQGNPQPVVSTLNNLTATDVANGAIVPAGTGGGIAAYASGNTQLIGDIDGYFAPAGTGGLSLYPASPCRALDTRQSGGAFSGERTVNMVGSVCAPPPVGRAYVLNATVLPQSGFGYLTLWPDGETQPVVSTLDAIDGAVTSNMAIVPTTNGSIDAYASGLTQLILDISSYFAP